MFPRKCRLGLGLGLGILDGLTILRRTFMAWFWCRQGSVVGLHWRHKKSQGSCGFHHHNQRSDPKSRDTLIYSVHVRYILCCV